MHCDDLEDELGRSELMTFELILNDVHSNEPFLLTSLLTEPSTRFTHRTRPTPLICENEYLVLPRGEETLAQAVVGSIV